MALKLNNPQLQNLTATPEKRTYVVAIITTVVVVLMIVFAIRPAIVSAFDKWDEIGKKREYVAALDTKYQNLVNLNDQYNSQAEILGILDDSFPEGRREEGMAVDLEALASQMDLSMESIKFSPGTTSAQNAGDLSKDVEYANVSIDIIGARSNVWRFISALEEYPRILNITKLGMNSRIDATGDTTKTVNAGITLEIYFYEED